MKCRLQFIRRGQLIAFLLLPFFCHAFIEPQRPLQPASTSTQCWVSVPKSNSNTNTDNPPKWLFPNAQADPDVSIDEYPLPPGKLGCPFLGRLDAIYNSPDFGTGEFYHRETRGWKHSVKKLWKYYFLGRPVAVISGVERIKEFLQKEFQDDGIATLTGPTVTVMLDGTKKKKKKKAKARMTGPESLLTETSPERHSQLRRLIGQAMTPAAVGKSIPQLQLTAQEKATKMIQLSKNDQTIRMEDICTEFTLDVAWRQILGLKLSEEEIPTFRRAVMDWIDGVASIPAILSKGVRFTKGYKARMYVEDLIEKRMEELKRVGRDTSTISGMVFATDDEDQAGSKGKVSLSQREVIDNAMALILAGSETSASTLMNAFLCLGLQPEKWQRLVDEQRRLQEEHGDDLTKEVLDGKNSPYLEAVVKETMRIRPIIAGVPRKTKATMIIDDEMQIPKGWIVNFSPSLTHQMDPKTYQEDNSHMDIVMGFQPERWLSEETRPQEFIALGAGPRYCLGANLAYAEMKVFLATMARSIDFSLEDYQPVNDPKEKRRVLWKRYSILPKEKKGVLVKVSKQEKANIPTP